MLLTDLMMPGMSGAELLKAAKAVSPETEVVLMTAYGTVETAVQAMKEGAYDFITKPLKRHAIVKVVRKALEKQALVAENRALKERLAEFAPAAGGRSSARARPFRAVMDIAAPGRALDGDGAAARRERHRQGAGRARHPRAARRARAAPSWPSTARPSPRPSSRASSSATSAAPSPAPSRARRAASSGPSGGTLFLDEIGEMSPSVQVKLLRVLQEGEIERLGGTGPIKVDVRIVAATNRDLPKLVRRGPLPRGPLLPAQRGRRWCCRRCASGARTSRCSPTTSCAMYAQKNQKPMARLLQGGARAARGATPGRATCASSRTPSSARWCSAARPPSSSTTCPSRCAAARRAAERHIVIPIGTPLEEIELRVIQETLRHTKGDKTLAAQLLGHRHAHHLPQARQGRAPRRRRGAGVGASPSYAGGAAGSPAACRALAWTFA